MLKLGRQERQRKWNTWLVKNFWPQSQSTGNNLHDKDEEDAQKGLFLPHIFFFFKNKDAGLSVKGWWVTATFLWDLA